MLKGNPADAVIADMALSQTNQLYLACNGRES